MTEVATLSDATMTEKDAPHGTGDTRRKGIKATVAYFNDDEEPQMCDNTRFKPMYDQTVPREITVQAIERPEDFHLDVQGFEWRKHRSAEQTFDDEARVRSAYYAECIELLREMTGATLFFSQGHVIRRELFSATEDHLAHDGTASAHLYPRPAAPLRYVHVDANSTQADKAWKYLLFDLQQQDPGLHKQVAESRRWQFYTVWRPIKPILRDPLALADARSISDEDYVTVPTYMREGLTYEAFSVRARGSASHRWYYAPGMEPDNVLVFKGYDSWSEDKDGRPVARWVPHVSFDDPTSIGGTLPARESIEYRAIAIY